jgi:hypothetical protein
MMNPAIGTPMRPAPIHPIFLESFIFYAPK